jgi:1-acyl-sn-glycerol-3-phosphate acyltransferase
MLKTSLETLITQHPQLLELFEHLATTIRHFASREAFTEGVDEFGRDPALMEKVRPLFQFLFDQYWRVETRGARNIPSKGRALIVANHSGTLAYDGAMIHMAVFNHQAKSRMTRFLVEDFIQYLPFLGTFFNRVGGVRACPENAERLLMQGELVSVFPEGIKGIGKLYRNRYQLARFGRGGIIRLAIKTQTPIIPCAVIGAEEIYPILWKTQSLAQLLGLPYLPITPLFPLLGPLGLIPLPSKWVISFGKPISYNHLPRKVLRDRLQIHALTEALRTTIQGMVNTGLKTREKLLTAQASPASRPSRARRRVDQTR